MDRRLRDWVATVLEGTEVSLSVPSRSAPGRGVGLYLLELANRPPLRNIKRAPLQFSCRYLVTTWAQDPEDAHSMLGRLVFSAMEAAEFRVDLTPPAPEVWQAFGAPPQPSFLLDVPVCQERPEPKTAIVREPIIINTSPITSFYGVVVGPGEIPVAAAAVEMPALRLYTRTDYKGRFLFNGVPSEPAEKVIEIRAKGRKLSVTSDRNYPGGAEPLVIHFNFLEG